MKKVLKKVKIIYILITLKHNISRMVIYLNLKKSRILAIFIIYILNFVFHFAYELFPNTLFSIFFPVNESIFEHQKLIFSSFMFYGIIDYFITRKQEVTKTSFFLSLIVSAFSAIGIFLLIWLPIFYKTGENMIVTFIVLFIAIALSQVISYYILKHDFKSDYIPTLSIILIIITYVVAAYLTYNPPKYEFFFDTKDEKYGIDTYVIR